MTQKRFVETGYNYITSDGVYKVYWGEELKSLTSLKLYNTRTKREAIREIICDSRKRLYFLGKPNRYSKSQRYYLSDLKEFLEGVNG